MGQTTMKQPTFVEGLKTARKLSGLSLREVEKATGVSNAYICQLEGGRIRKPSPFILRKLSQLYGIDHESLMEQVGYLERPSEKPKSMFTKFLDANLTEEEEYKLLEYLQFIRRLKQQNNHEKTNT